MQLGHVCLVAQNNHVEETRLGLLHLFDVKAHFIKLALEQLHCFFLSRIGLVQIAQKHLLVFFAHQIAQQVLNVKLVLVFVGICELLIPLDHLFELQIELFSELKLGFEHVFAHLTILVNQLVLKQKHLLLNEAVLGLLQLVLRN